MEQELNNLLDVWYPRVVDTEHGGYLSRFTHDWEPDGSQEKMIVTQVRHLWTLSKVGQKYPDDSSYLEYAAHGFDFLRQEMWDETHGGFYQLVTREGDAILGEEGEINKTLYGNAFAIYGLAAYYEFSDNAEALDLARRTFEWLENHAYDPAHGGYFQPLARDGTPDTTGYPKDYNSGIHILEALTELYTVWPDEGVRDRLEEMFIIVRDTMTTDRGNLKLYFQPDWTHLSYRDSTESTVRANIGRDHITPGHDIETAYLLLEAAHALGLDQDPATLEIAKKLTDHTLETGWDGETGGFYDIGYYFKGDDELTILRDTKNWWAQAEGLNTLLMMAEIWPEDPRRYFNKFTRQWEYIKMYLIDHDHKGWYDSGLDKSPERRTALKSHIWKGNYHTVRSLMGCLERLDEFEKSP
ncbi:MAG: AGE family epimerase/isomerase, partial [Balneolaceae bacterium]